jgi:uncharacterized protein with PQ loop repeat
MQIVGYILIFVSAVLEVLAYLRQIEKIRKTRRSKDISSTSYLYKFMKYICAMISLFIFANWQGLTLEIIATIVFLVAFYEVIKNKPDGWHLF